MRRRFLLMPLVVVMTLGLSMSGCAASSPAAPVVAQATRAESGQVVTVTGHGLSSLSETEFRFAAGAATYLVLMDLSTKCINLRGKLLGGYQLVSRIVMATSLPLTITGLADGLTIHAQTVLIPTDNDALT